MFGHNIDDDDDDCYGPNKYIRKKNKIVVYITQFYVANEWYVCFFLFQIFFFINVIIDKEKKIKEKHTHTDTHTC